MNARSPRLKRAVIDRPYSWQIYRLTAVVCTLDGSAESVQATTMSLPEIAILGNPPDAAFVFPDSIHRRCRSSIRRNLTHVDLRTILVGALDPADNGVARRQTHDIDPAGGIALVDSNLFAERLSRIRGQAAHSPEASHQAP